MKRHGDDMGEGELKGNSTANGEMIPRSIRIIVRVIKVVSLTSGFNHSCPCERLLTPTMRYNEEAWR
jgi:hypothetical protein